MSFLQKLQNPNGFKSPDPTRTYFGPAGAPDLVAYGNMVQEECNYSQKPAPHRKPFNVG